MAGKQIGEFVEGDLIEGFFALRDAVLKTASNGRNYIFATFGDSTGVISGNLWDADRNLFATLTPGGIVKIQAMAEVYKGNLQLKIGRIRMAGPDEAKLEDFLPQSRFPIEDMERELDGIIARIQDNDYQRLLQAFFGNAEFRNAFRRAPAAKGNHHAWVGGLLEHTLSMARYALAFVQNSPVRLNRDLLLTGTILHDVGKIHELTLGATIEYSDYGKLIGHISIGNLLIAEKIKDIPDFPVEKQWLIQHLILSHHGKLEFGSPVLPMVPEAMVLNHIDNLDAKTIAAERILHDDGTSGNWTARSFMLETSLYRPAESRTGDVAAAAAEVPAVPSPDNAAAPDKKCSAGKKSTHSGGGLFGE